VRAPRTNENQLRARTRVIRKRARPIERQEGNVEQRGHPHCGYRGMADEGERAEGRALTVQVMTPDGRASLRQKI
jgi:hypothetical protein